MKNSEHTGVVKSLSAVHQKFAGLMLGISVDLSLLCLIAHSAPCLALNVLLTLPDWTQGI